MDIYRKFIGNFMKAKASIEIAKQTKSVFSKFLEVNKISVLMGSIACHGCVCSCAYSVRVCVS